MVVVCLQKWLSAKARVQVPPTTSGVFAPVILFLHSPMDAIICAMWPNKLA